MYRLAHLSDPHVGPLPPARPTELLNKRILGYLSWHRRRRKLHRPEVLEALLADLTAIAPDHIAVTGDVANISLPREFHQGAEWLARLGAPDKVSLVPGNHDAYVAMPWQDSWRHWGGYMAGDPNTAVTHHRGFDDFPYLRRRGELALIGLSSALPTPPAFASGTLGAEQLKRLEDLLEASGQEGLCRVILLHHPPAGAVKRRKRLTDAEAFCQVVARQGAELVLHGHDHTTTQLGIPGPQGPVPVLGISSASVVKAGKRPASQYRLLAIASEGKNWRLEIALRGYVRANGTFTEVARESYSLARAHP